MKVFSIIGNKKLREEIAPKIIQSLEDEGKTVGFIKRTDQISSNSQTKRAVIWGETQSLFYQEGRSTLHDLLKLFDEEYIIIDNDENSNVPKLLMFEETNIEDTQDVNDIGAMNNLKRREDLFFTADKDTALPDIISAIKGKVFEVLPDLESDSCDICGKSCRDLTISILKDEALREDCTVDREPVELIVGEEKLDLEPALKNILQHNVESVAQEIAGYRDSQDISLKIRK